MAQECKRWVDAHSKQLIVVVVDAFGQSAQVQVPLLQDEIDHHAEVNALLKLMNDNEQKFIAKLKAMNMSDQEIEKLKKSPADCGCSK
jgi:hypothetical protein